MSDAGSSDAGNAPEEISVVIKALKIIDRNVIEQKPSFLLMIHTDFVQKFAR